MPLSEYEQRVLDQMERQLSSDDPKLASTLSTSRRRTGRVLIGLLVAVLGLAPLVGGVALEAPWLGIIGFLMMLAGSLWAMSKPRAKEGDEGAASPAQEEGKGRGGKRSGSKARTKQPFLDRLEDRWNKRREDGAM